MAVMSGLEVRVLGTAAVSVGPESLRFGDDKRYQLLAHLACKSDWVPREQVASLFWPDTTTPNARKNLRHLIQRTRTLGWLEGFDAELEHLRWRVQTDLARFRSAVEAGRWDEALRLYGGPLLEGHLGPESPEYSDWLGAEREVVRGQWHAAALHQAGALLHGGAPAEALRVLETLLLADPLDEDALGQLMRVAVHTDQRGLGLRAYGAYRERLSMELNLPPARVLEELASGLEGQEADSPALTPAGMIERRRIPQGQAISVQAISGQAVSDSGQALMVQPPARQLPSASTPLIGRESLLAELALVTGLLGAGVVTLVGTGGVGKTRAALHFAASQLRDTVFVNLVPLSTVGEVPTAIASSLGLTLTGSAPPLDQVAAHIGQRSLLLVIDNFEHLMAARSDVAALAQRCPHLLMLITSRERLGLPEERVIPVEAFPLPEAAEAQVAHSSGLETVHLETVRLETGHSLETVRSSEAVRLFAYHARRVRPGFDLSDTVLPAVLEVCRLVDGLPLGIELAAVWVRVLGVADIARELSVNLDLLSSEHGGVQSGSVYSGSVYSGEGRHRSVRAAFEHSWALLTDQEQRALRRCSVFMGGFTREAARLSAQVPLPVLASLIDKSLLILGDHGRYKRHRLLHQFSIEKALEHPEELQQSRGNHAEHCLRVLQQGLEGVRGQRSRAALETMELEFENVRAAWRWALAGPQALFLKNASEALMRFFDARGRFTEALEMFGEAAGTLNEGVPAERAALGVLQVHLSKFQQRRGLNTQAAQTARRGLQLLEGLEERESVIWGLGHLGTATAALGDHAASGKHRRAALEQARALGNERLIAVALGWVAIHLERAGETLPARTHYLEAVTLFRQLGNHIGALFNLNNLCELLIASGEHQQASVLLQEALQLARQSGELSQIPSILAQLGRCSQGNGEPEAALDYARQALAAERVSGDDAGELIPYLRDLAEFCHALGQSEEVRAHLQEALGHAWETQRLGELMDLLALWPARIDTAPALAARLEQIVWQHPASSDALRAQAAAHLHMRGGDLMPDLYWLEGTVAELRLG